MKAVLVRAYGDAEELQYGDTNQPQAGDGEVLIRIRATSINPLDWKMRSGAAKEEFPIHLSEILGVDIAGEIARTAARRRSVHLAGRPAQRRPGPRNPGAIHDGATRRKAAR